MKIAVAKEIITKPLTASIQKKYPTLGGDPEFFITTKKGKTLSACQFLPSKNNKAPVYTDSSTASIMCGEYFFDGVQGEINILPGTCREGLASRIWRVMNRVKTEIGNNHRLVMKPSVLVSRDVLDNADPEARRFGCSPDYNAYTGLQNESGLDGDKHRVRYGGGHIHIGFNKEDRMYDDPEVFLGLVKLLDLIVGIPMLLLDVGPASNRRRKYYGKAGTFRETKWGVEYRQPSNVWLRSPELASLAWGLTRTAYRIMIAKAEDAFWNVVKPEEVRKAIDTSNLDRCIEIYNRVRGLVISASHVDDPFCGKINRTYIKDNKEYYQVFVNGAEVYEYVLDKTVNTVYGEDFEKSWEIKPTGSGNRYVGVPLRITNGFINGTLSIIKTLDKDNYEKLTGKVLK